MVASVPDEVKRTRSAEGTNRSTQRAHSISSRWLAPRCVPCERASVTAWITSGRP